MCQSVFKILKALKFNLNSVENQSEKQRFDMCPNQTLLLKEMH